jgi:hypothetical protein
MRPNSVQKIRLPSVVSTLSTKRARFAVGGQSPGSFVARYPCLMLKLRESSGKLEYVSGHRKSIVSPNAQCAFIFLLQSLKVLAHLEV